MLHQTASCGVRRTSVHILRKECEFWLTVANGIQASWGDAEKEEGSKAMWFAKTRDSQCITAFMADHSVLLSGFLIGFLRPVMSLLYLAIESSESKKYYVPS